MSRVTLMASGGSRSTSNRVTSGLSVTGSCACATGVFDKLTYTSNTKAPIRNKCTVVTVLALVALHYRNGCKRGGCGQHPRHFIGRRQAIAAIDNTHCNLEQQTQGGRGAYADTNTHKSRND